MQASRSYADAVR